jgi:hypothetical protein
MKRWMSPLPAGRAVALGTIALGLALVMGSFGVRAFEPPGQDNQTKESVPSVLLYRQERTEAGSQAVPREDSKETKTESQPPAPRPPQAKGFLRYGGKSFEDWRRIMMTDLKPETRIEAIKALSAFGANGYGKEAAEAIIQLMRGYEFPGRDRDDQNVINAAESAFRKIGPEGASALIEELEHGKLNGRRFAIAALQNMGPAAKDALPTLREKQKGITSGEASAIQEALRKISK